MILEMTDIDIIMITKNSVEPCLDESLKSIAESVKISGITPRLIVVDSNSKDETLAFIERHKELNPLILFDEGNRATARQKGIEHVSSELFAFIDSDVVLTQNWFSQIIPYFEDPKVGAVWGAAIQTALKRRKYFEAMAKLYGKRPLDMMKSYGEQRGCLHDTMIRTEAVKDIKIPPHLHVMEDHFVRSYLENKGWIWVSTDKPFVYHNMGEDSPDNAYMDAYYGWKLGVYNRTWYAKHLALSWAKLLYLLLSTRDVQVVRSEAVKEWQFLKASIRILWEALV
jgi:glycosyltransferase involved in cell wall biosynthesis